MSVVGTVFVVDEDPVALDAMQQLLASAGLRSKCYVSPPEHLDCADCERPGLLVLESYRGAVSGLELLTKLLELGFSLPVIVLSSQRGESISSKAWRMLVDFVQAPVDANTSEDHIDQGMQLGQHRPSVQARIDCLTPREREVMDLLVAGNTVKRIANLLNVTGQTAARHRANILKKMQVEGDVQLVRLLLSRHQPLPDPIVPAS